MPSDSAMLACGTEDVKHVRVVRVEAHFFAEAKVEPPEMDSGMLVSQMAWRLVLRFLYSTWISLPPTSRFSQ